MNTIPLIFNERQIKRTVLGGKNDESTIFPSDAKIPCSLVLLNRGSNHYRQQTIDSLQSIGFAQIISVENSSLSYNLEDFALRHPHVKFVIPQEKTSIGDMINIGIAECSQSHALVIWNDVHIAQNFFTRILYDKLIAEDILCFSPTLQSSVLQTLPVAMRPSIEKTRFTVLPSNPQRDKEKTIYPFDFIGFYDRQKFMQLGGFDYTITTPYWQNLDFSLRAWLWGEEIRISTLFKLKYEDDSPSEDSTADTTQLRFYLKNCAPTFNTDYAYIPKARFFSFAKLFPGTPFESFKAFIDARKWVETNRFRYRTDVTNLIATWHYTPEDLHEVGL